MYIIFRLFYKFVLILYISDFIFITYFRMQLTLRPTITV